MISERILSTRLSNTLFTFQKFLLEFPLSMLLRFSVGCWNGGGAASDFRHNYLSLKVNNIEQHCSGTEYSIFVCFSCRFEHRALIHLPLLLLPLLFQLIYLISVIDETLPRAPSRISHNRVLFEIFRNFLHIYMVWACDEKCSDTTNDALNAMN